MGRGPPGRLTHPHRNATGQREGTSNRPLSRSGGRHARAFIPWSVTGSAGRECQDPRAASAGEATIRSAHILADALAGPGTGCGPRSRAPSARARRASPRHPAWAAFLRHVQEGRSGGVELVINNPVRAAHGGTPGAGLTPLARAEEGPRGPSGPPVPSRDEARLGVDTDQEAPDEHSPKPTAHRSSLRRPA